MTSNSGRSAIFTIVSANYIGFAATLMQSVARFHPEADRYIILSDAYMEFPDLVLPATVIGCDQMGIPLIENMKLWYTVIEFNTAVKPFSFLYFFKLEYATACYIDPDIRLFAPLREVFDALVHHSCILTPHMMQPLQDGFEPSDLTIMKSGVYNLGFLGLKNDSDGNKLAEWWSDRCFDSCRVDIPGNMFTDQRWMDLAPAFVERPYILRHPGYNVAYWNLASRRVSKDDCGNWMVNGFPLVFFHFSGIKPEDPTQFSKHTNRFTINNLGEVADLCALYRTLVLENKWLKYNKTPYSFGKFRDGRPIEDAMRHWLARAVDRGIIEARKPLAIESDFFDQEDEEAEKKGAAVTRFMYQFWLDRPDLQDAFQIYDPKGLDAYSHWFLNDSDVKRLVDGRSLNAVTRLKSALNKKPQSAAAIAKLVMPPWPSVMRQSWLGSSLRVDEFLSQCVFVEFAHATRMIPYQFALLWERRADLQKHFPIANAEECDDFLCWALTYGSEEGAVNSRILPAQFVALLNELSRISDYYGDIPITVGLTLTRKTNVARNLGSWQHFPVERASRLSHGLWYTFVASTLFGWPGTLGSELRKYFHGPSAVSVDGFSLSRGAIAVWELRPDVQRLFALTESQSIWRYLRWLALFGLAELGASIEDFDPRLAEYLRSPSPRYDDVSQVVEMVHDWRSDLKSAYDISSPDGRAGVNSWAFERMPQEFPALYKVLTRLIHGLPEKALADIA